ncbi:MAG TPA: DUF1707 domain-containing protein [Streptosporangiaceae bacterium]|nr:DUF1707 domain-containing protein [Streptosporangiaceae bacterium]
MRVGDAEREAVAAQLREHYADGRLTLDELNERLDQAFAARTRADLTAVTRDLPVSGRPFATTSPAAGLNPWQDATSGSSGSSHSRRQFAMLAPMMALVWLFVILGSLFAFGLGGEKPLAIVFFLAALAFLRRLLGFRRRRGGGPRGRRCGRRW